MAQSASHGIGAGLVLLVDVLWTASNFVTSSLLTASFVVYLVPFLILFSLGADLSRRKSPGKERWYEKIGFRLPPMYPSKTISKCITHSQENLVDSAIERMRSMPASISSITPQDTSPHSHIDVRLGSDVLSRTKRDVRSSQNPHRPTFARGRSHTVRGLEEHDELISNSATPTYGSGETASTPESQVEPLGWVDGSCVNTEPMSIYETVKLAAEFAVVWFAANWSFVASMGYTSVASSTTLGSTSGFFTLFLGRVLGVESFALGKLASVVLSFSGVLLTTWADSSSTHTTSNALRPMLGDMLALISAICYAIYVTLLKKRTGSDDRISMPLFLGLVGLVNIIAFWPVGFLLHWLDIESFALPSDTRTWTGILVNTAITIISDFAYLLAILKSSPLFTTVGLSLTIPMAAIGSAIHDPSSIRIQNVLGSLLVLLSFGAIAWEENWST